MTKRLIISAVAALAVIIALSLSTGVANAAPKFDPSDANDATFVSKLKPATMASLDEDELILAGYDVCAMMDDDGASLISTAAGVMDNYDVSGAAASDIAATAVSVYCPSMG